MCLFGILLVRKSLGPALGVESPNRRNLARLGVCLSPHCHVLPSSWEHPTCRQGWAGAIWQLGLCLWLEDSKGPDGSS